MNFTILTYYTNVYNLHTWALVEINMTKSNDLSISIFFNDDIFIFFSIRFLFCFTRGTRDLMDYSGRVIPLLTVSYIVAHDFISKCLPRDDCIVFIRVRLNELL